LLFQQIFAIIIVNNEKEVRRKNHRLFKRRPSGLIDPGLTEFVRVAVAPGKLYELINGCAAGDLSKCR
jgi:hypothetical protein